MVDILSLIVARIVTNSDNLQLIMNSSGTVIENNRTLPYGEAWLAENTPSTNDKKFTTYQRDQESGLDYAGARYFANTNGRFASPDQGRLFLSRPTTLNRYLYTSDDPINKIDPDGMEERQTYCDIYRSDWICTPFGMPPPPPDPTTGVGGGLTSTVYALWSYSPKFGQVAKV